MRLGELRRCRHPTTEEMLQIVSERDCTRPRECAEGMAVALSQQRSNGSLDWRSGLAWVARGTECVMKTDTKAGRDGWQCGTKSTYETQSWRYSLAVRVTAGGTDGGDGRAALIILGGQW